MQLIGKGFKQYRIAKANIPEGLPKRKGKALAALEEWLDRKFKLSFQLVKEEYQNALSDELIGIEEMHGVVSQPDVTPTYPLSRKRRSFCFRQFIVG